MKSTISKQSIEEPEKEYPLLMINRDKDLIILFTAETTGTVVYTKSSYHPIGKVTSAWVPAEFKAFKGEVSLSN